MGDRIIRINSQGVLSNLEGKRSPPIRAHDNDVRRLLERECHEDTYNKPAPKYHYPPPNQQTDK